MAVLRPHTKKGGADRAQEIYFVQADKLRLIKIGSADHADRRLLNLQCGSPDRLTLMGIIMSPLSDRLEERLHSQFFEHRLHGEWFEPAPELLAFIAANARTHEEIYLEMIGWNKGPEPREPAYWETHPRPAPEPKRKRGEPVAATPLPKIKANLKGGRKAILAAYKAARGLAA
jgi:hypothetical protein